MFFAKIVTLKSNVDQRVVDIIHKIAEAEREKAQAENRDLTEAETTRQKLILPAKLALADEECVKYVSGFGCGCGWLGVCEWLWAWICVNV